MTREMAKAMPQHFMDARLIGDAIDKYVIQNHPEATRCRSHNILLYVGIDSILRFLILTTSVATTSMQYAEGTPLPTMPEERHCQWRILHTRQMPKTLLPMQRRYQ